MKTRFCKSDFNENISNFFASVVVVIIILRQQTLTNSITFDWLKSVSFALVTDIRSPSSKLTTDISTSKTFVYK